MIYAIHTQLRIRTCVCVCCVVYICPTLFVALFREMYIYENISHEHQLAAKHIISDPEVCAIDDPEIGRLKRIYALNVGNNCLVLVQFKLEHTSAAPCSA